MADQELTASTEECHRAPGQPRRLPGPLGAGRRLDGDEPVGRRLERSPRDVAVVAEVDLAQHAAGHGQRHESTWVQAVEPDLADDLAELEHPGDGAGGVLAFPVRRSR